MILLTIWAKTNSSFDSMLSLWARSTCATLKITNNESQFDQNDISIYFCNEFKPKWSFRCNFPRIFYGTKKKLILLTLRNAPLVENKYQLNEYFNVNAIDRQLFCYYYPLELYTRGVLSISKHISIDWEIFSHGINHLIYK